MHRFPLLQYSLFFVVLWLCLSHHFVEARDLYRITDYVPRNDLILLGQYAYLSATFVAMYLGFSFAKNAQVMTLARSVSHLLTLLLPVYLLVELCLLVLHQFGLHEPRIFLPAQSLMPWIILTGKEGVVWFSLNTLAFASGFCLAHTSQKTRKRDGLLLVCLGLCQLIGHDYLASLFTAKYHILFTWQGIMICYVGFYLVYFLQIGLLGRGYRETSAMRMANFALPMFFTSPMVMTLLQANMFVYMSKSDQLLLGLVLLFLLSKIMIFCYQVGLRVWHKNVRFVCDTLIKSQ